MSKALPLTRAAWPTLRARLVAAMGLPRVPTEADRVGGGIHVPFALAATTEAVEYDETTGEAIVPAELEAMLTVGERAALRAQTHRELAEVKK